MKGNVMFVADTMNNVRRLCSLPGDRKSRRWQVKNAMETKQDRFAYLVKNLDTNEFRCVTSKQMTSLY